MKPWAGVPARALSKVITTAPASPVPASSRSFPASSVSRNWGLFGLKKLRGCGSEGTTRRGRGEGHRQRGPAVGAPHLQGGRNNGAVAEMHAIEIAHRHHRSLRNGGRGRGVADNGKTERHFRDSSTRAGGGRDRDLVAPTKSSRAQIGVLAGAVSVFGAAAG